MSREIVEIRYNWGFDSQGNGESCDSYELGKNYSTPWFQGEVLEISEFGGEMAYEVDFEEGHIIIYNPNKVVYRNETGGKK